MGGRSNVSSFGGSNSARHLITHNKHHDGKILQHFGIAICIGVEAPRNSLDLPLETANKHHVINENLMVSYTFLFQIILVELQSPISSL
ncbi:hypothetical protein IEQ34_026957 [Dendrobium chrysotoxum]|uniref:Uncharacterized protein n=1 Tax=Dendrobium chrysotoxum TaxID=161865 RepID=A0AAV7FIF1_DENCH|nr:hypothetical protein IEQ34_026957 [Dendrobium chrysotoxum]